MKAHQKLQICCCLIPTLFSTLSAGQSAAFQYPTGNETYNILDTIEVQWTSNYQTPILFTWVWDSVTSDGEEVSQIANIPSSGTFSYNLNAHGSNISLFGSYPAHLWFDLIYDLSVPGHQGGDDGFSFTVTSNAAATPTTWVLTTSTSSFTTSTSSSTTFSSSSTASKSPTVSPTVTPTVIPNIHSGLSTGAKAGIGIGAAVVAIALLVLFVWFIMSKRRIRRLEDQIAQSTGTENMKPELHGYPVVATEAQRNPALYEMQVRYLGQNQADGAGNLRYELH